MEGISATGDIWSTGAFSFESPLKDLLDRGGYTLEELLAEDELLQELRGMHPELINFFSTEEALVGLVQYATRMHPEKPVLMNGNNGSVTPPEETTREEKDIPETEETSSNEENEEKNPGQWLLPPMEKPSGSFAKTPEEQEELETIRYPYMACEVICCEINSIIDILVDGHVPTTRSVKGHVEQDNETCVEVTAKEPLSILDLLFSLLKETNVGELDDYRAGYFDKILSVLFRKRPKAMSAYMNDGGVPLMTAMMNHLYSHSIMQIVQRLLMPPPSSFLNEDMEDPDEQDDNLNSLFQCEWSELPESMELLLDSLTVSSNTVNNEDLILSKAQSASEVLITVIQNSPLTSPTLLTLTTDPIMGRIMKAACTLEDGADFVASDSTLTCAMNVLESIVLQLGGYGSVGTALETASEEEEDEETDDKPQDDPVVNGDDASIELEVSKILKSAQEVANADTLILHLPDLLKSLCGLLRHPSTSTWQSPMQFAKNEQQALLGMSRLRIVRLIESLVLLGNPKVDAILCESDCLVICLDLFWEFQWCSMLHQSVANLLVHVFEGANERAELQEYFLVKCNLLRRLMDSFEDPEEAKEAKGGDTLNDAVMALRRLHLKTRSASIQSERGSSIGSIDAALGEDVITVSDDDVDAALEQQDDSELDSLEKSGHQDETSTEPSTSAAVVKTEETTNEVKSSIPSLRMGCLGHVIIICQALVHACTADMNESHEDATEQQDGANQNTLMRSIDLGESAPVSRSEDRTSDTDSNEDEDKGESSESEALESAKSEEDGDDDKDDSVQSERSDSERSLSNDLIIAQLVRTHPLHDEWNHFITSTLAAETAIQSTPLGGTNTAPVDPMQSQISVGRSVRSYDFTGDDEDDIADINARGFLGGEVLDMDDNDLDIAASMMEALNMARPRESGDDDVDKSNEGQEGISHSFGTVVQNSSAGSGDYLFDDPLGGNARFGGSFGSQDDSSDEEEEPGESTADTDHPSSANSSGDSEEDAPVMDLFTGNFASPENGTFSNFANFDDAFAAAGAIETPAFSSGDEDIVFKPSSTAIFQATEAMEDETDIFGTTPPHALLLADEDTENAEMSVNTTAEAPVERSSETEVDPTAEIVHADLSSEAPISSETPAEKTEEDDTKEDTSTEMGSPAS